MARPKLVMGNWKMNLSKAEAVDLASGLAAGVPSIPGVTIAVCPSMVHLDAVSTRLAGSLVELGAQDCAAQGPGPVTGASSVDQLVELGAEWVLVGHSERRALFGETDSLIAAKCAAATAGGLRPVLCVGETLEERDGGRTSERILRQIDAALPVSPSPGFSVAYEPVWAIGTGRNASLSDVVEVHELIRARIAERAGEGLAETTCILYGGSVNQDNAGEYLAHPQIDGALVGGASLAVSRFLEICAAGAEGPI